MADDFHSQSAPASSIILPRFLATCAIWCVSFREFLLRKYYNYLTNIDMVLLRTSYMYGGFLEYYFRLQFSAFWSMHDKTSSWENANFKMYPSPKKAELPPEKTSTTWKISNTLTRNSSHWEYLNPMRKLLEKYSPSYSLTVINLANRADGSLCFSRWKLASLGQQVNIFKLHKIATCNSNFEKSLIQTCIIRLWIFRPSLRSIGLLVIVQQRVRKMLFTCQYY